MEVRKSLAPWLKREVHQAPYAVMHLGLLVVVLLWHSSGQEHVCDMSLTPLVCMAPTYVRRNMVKYQ